MDEFEDNFDIMKQGAEARLYKGRFLGQPAVIKERFAKSYRHPDLDAQLNKERMKGEVRSLMRCKNIGIRTPTIYSVDGDKGLLIMEYVDAPTCRNFIQDRIEDPSNPKLIEMSKKIGRSIAILHKNNVIHGDITTSNILVEQCDPEIKLCFIDFGLGFAQGTPEDKGVDLYVLERALISTHPTAGFMFDAILKGYKTELRDRKTECETVMKKFEEVRMRGRKRDMVG